jgi:hypothetical protein
MNKDHRVDDVRGQVVGGYWRSGRVYYEDRPQGPMITAETEEEVREIAQARVAEYKAMTAGDLIYPNPKAWTVRIYAG